MLKVKNPVRLDIHIEKVGWFKHEITTIYYNEDGESYAQGKEFGYGIKDTQTIIDNSIYWATIKRKINSDKIRVINRTNTYFRKIK